MSKALPEKCYLCGKPLCAPTSVDHVPPKQLFAPSIRKEFRLQLVTIPTHAACNTSYQHDEDYFVHTLMPFAWGTKGGRAIYDEVLQKFRAGKKTGLTWSVLKEFEPRPSGLFLAGDKVVKRFKGSRINRVVWKILRGLNFLATGIVLPETHPILVSLTPVSQGQSPPDHFLAFMQHSNATGLQSHGMYEGIFSYRFDKFTDVDSVQHYWAFLLWDSVLFTIMFHDPVCSCYVCAQGG